MPMKNILILCTGNSCRSQMAEGFLKTFDARLNVFSAGTEPAGAVHPLAIVVMGERGIDISASKPKHAAQFKDMNFDYVITVCGAAKEACPVFTGKVAHRLHMGFIDPAGAVGTEEDKLTIFRAVRDEIIMKFTTFCEGILQ